MRELVTEKAPFATCVRSDLLVRGVISCSNDSRSIRNNIAVIYLQCKTRRDRVNLLAAVLIVCLGYLDLAGSSPPPVL